MGFDPLLEKTPDKLMCMINTNISRDQFKLQTKYRSIKIKLAKNESTWDVLYAQKLPYPPLTCMPKTTEETTQVKIKLKTYQTLDK